MLKNLMEPGKPDWLFLSDLIGSISLFGVHLGDARISNSCQDGSCTAVKGTITSESEPPQEWEIGETSTVDDYGLEGLFDDSTTPLDEITPRTLHGMNIVHLEYRESVGDFSGSGGFRGGWLEHQMFGALSAEPR